MPSATEYKAEGNKAFGAKDMSKAVSCYSKALELEKDEESRAALLSNRSAAYLGLQQYEKALLDANNAVLRRPTWSKAYARVAECCARQQDFQRAQQAYRQAITHAEDAATKARYESSLQTTVETGKKAAKVNKQGFGATGIEDHFVTKINRLVREEGVVFDPAGGIALTIWAGQQCEEGMRILDDVLKARTPDGQVMGNPSSQAVPNICECILLDDYAFTLTRGRDPNFPLPDKFNAIYEFEIMAHGGMKYFGDAVWDPKDVIADLDKRLATEGQERIRRLCSQMIRGTVLAAFGLGINGEVGASSTQCKFAIGLLEEGAKKWASIPFEAKGMCFKPTFVRVVRVFLLKCLLRAARDAKTASAKRTFSLESVEKLAKEIIAENKESDWPPANGSMMRIGYFTMPHWEAYAALAFVYSMRARGPIIDPPPGQALFASIEAAKKAAEYYDKCCSYMPEDYHARPEFEWNAINWHLRAGGLTIRELSKRVEKAERISNWLARIFGDLGRFEARDFASTQLNSILELTHATAIPDQPAATLDSTIKAIPVFIARGISPASVLLPEETWDGYPGDVAVADIWG